MVSGKYILIDQHTSERLNHRLHAQGKLNPVIGTINQCTCNERSLNQQLTKDGLSALGPWHRQTVDN